ncbi:MAG: bacteriocin transport accessory protein [Agathobacter sp.]|nr:bacteriocin transport accessory protein [Agathobacter sp.]
MKKITVLLLAIAMTFICVACGNSGNADNGGSTEIKDATELLTNAWTEYNESASDDLKFAVGGGNIENFELVVMDAPGKCDTSLEGAKDALSVSFCIPMEAIDMTDDAANMMNMMMANNFSAAAYHVADSANVEKVVAGIKDATLGNRWMCGFPEKLIVVTVDGDYVVSAFGNGQVIDAFKAALTTVYGDAVVVSVEEALAE